MIVNRFDFDNSWKKIDPLLFSFNNILFVQVSLYFIVKNRNRETSSHGATPIIPWHAMTIPKLWIRNGPQRLNWATKRPHNPLLCSDRPPPLFVRSGIQRETAAFPCAIAFITQGMHKSVPWSLYICNLVYVSSSFIWFRRFWYHKNTFQEQSSFNINLNLNLKKIYL